MEEKVPTKESSSFAEEGTLAHEFADLELRIQSYVGKIGKGTPKAKWLAEKEELKKHALYDPEMHEYVNTYVDYVLEQLAEARKSTVDAVLKVEERTDFSYLVPEGFGTSDANIIADNTLEIVDLKYGKGVKVDAKGNAQLRLYALGLLRKYSLVYDIDQVKMSIVQPRLYHIDSEVLSADELEKWAKETVQFAANKAYEGEGECNPGDWCRWCRAKPTCRAIANHNLKLANKEFAEPKTLSDEELLEVYEQIGVLVDWASSVSGHVKDEALAGKHWPGYKLVEGRSNRKWKDDSTVQPALIAQGFSSDQITNTKMKGIGEVEKLVGKVVFQKLDLTVKPPGAPTLVVESDKRPAMGIEQAKKDFE